MMSSGSSSRGAARSAPPDETELTADTWETRYLALKRVAADRDLPIDERVRLLTRGAGDEHRTCRLVAAIALAALTTEAGAALLEPLTALASDSDPWVRLRAAQGLGAAGATDVLAQRLRSESDVRVRATVVKSLGACGDARYLDLLAALLSDPDARVRANAVEGLGACATPAVAELLLPYLEDASSRVRANTARVLLGFNRPRALAAFKQLAHASDANARASAAFTLGAVTDPAAVALLFELAQDASPLVRKNALEALVRHGRSAESGFVTLLSSASGAVRAAACEGLARVGTRTTWPRLLEHLEDPDGSVREACVRALEAVEGRFVQKNRRDRDGGTARSSGGTRR